MPELLFSATLMSYLYPVAMLVWPAVLATGGAVLCIEWLTNRKPETKSILKLLAGIWLFLAGVSMFADAVYIVFVVGV